MRSHHFRLKASILVIIFCFSLIGIQKISAKEKTDSVDKVSTTINQLLNSVMPDPPEQPNDKKPKFVSTGDLFSFNLILFPEVYVWIKKITESGEVGRVTTYDGDDPDNPPTEHRPK